MEIYENILKPRLFIQSFTCNSTRGWDGKAAPVYGGTSSFRENIDNTIKKSVKYQLIS